MGVKTGPSTQFHGSDLFCFAPSARNAARLHRPDSRFAQSLWLVVPAGRRVPDVRSPCRGMTAWGRELSFERHPIADIAARTPGRVDDWRGDDRRGISVGRVFRFAVPH